MKLYISHTDENKRLNSVESTQKFEFPNRIDFISHTIEMLFWILFQFYMFIFSCAEKTADTFCNILMVNSNFMPNCRWIS